MGAAKAQAQSVRQKRGRRESTYFREVAVDPDASGGSQGSKARGRLRRADSYVKGRDQPWSLTGAGRPMPFAQGLTKEQVQVKC